MMSASRVLSCIAIGVLASGCATQGATWSSVAEDSRTVQIGDCSVDLPGGWMVLKGGQNDRQLVSRDGANLQSIEVARAKLEEAFPKLKRGAPTGALPSELAELQIAEMRAALGVADLSVVKNEPIEIAGTTGYSLLTRYKNAKGLRYERMVVGFAKADGYYTLSYQAPTLHYFERDRGAFDALLRSFRAGGASKPG